MPDGIETSVPLPFLKDFYIPLGLFFLAFAAIVIVGSSNTVNLTDGLDGLAIVPVMVAAMSYLLICYVTGNVKYAEYLNILYVPGAEELAIICAGIFWRRTWVLMV